MIAYLITRHQRVFQTKKKLPNVEREVTLKIRFCHFCSGSAIQKQFSNNIFISIRPIPVQTKVHFKSLQLFIVTFDMRFLHRAIHVVSTGVAY